MKGHNEDYERANALGQRTGLIGNRIDPEVVDLADKANNELIIGNYDKAIAHLDRAIKIAPDFAPAYVGRGDAKDAKGDYDGAIADYNRAVELDPSFADAYYNRGRY